MSEKLISKKNLLEKMNISYGQLYRWKRKKLIPEEWFIKKSVSTGQETFFPEEKVIDRITKILELKDDVSLDELAEQFTCDLSKFSIKKEDLIKLNLISENIINSFEKNFGAIELYLKKEIFALIIYNELLCSGKLSACEVKEVITAIINSYIKLKETDYIIIKRKLGVLFYYVTNSKEQVLEDKDSIILMDIGVKEIFEHITKIKL